MSKPNSIKFLGNEITDQIVFDAIPGAIIKESMRYEEGIYTFGGQVYLRIYSDNSQFADYNYTFVPIKRANDHAHIDRNNLPKPYFTISREGMKAYEK